MLQSATARFTPANSYASLSADSNLDHAQLTLARQAIAVSSSDNVALHETASSTDRLTMSSSTTHSSVSNSNHTSLYTADTAVMALTLFGAWMMVVGGAMLSRHLRLTRE